MVACRAGIPLVRIHMCGVAGYGNHLIARNHPSSKGEIPLFGCIYEEDVRVETQYFGEDALEKRLRGELLDVQSETFGRVAVVGRHGCRICNLDTDLREEVGVLGKFDYGPED